MRDKENNQERTVVKGLSFNGVAQDGNTVQVDLKDGKIVRIRPFHFDWKYDRKPWRMEARGKVFEASMKCLIPPFTLAYKNRIDSPNRVMYPLKRVDWDPNGDPGSTGPGGQSVNTTDSAVRITHLPTGLVVTCQDEKSQLKNKNRAMKVLRARLLDQMIQDQNAKRSEERRSQVGSGDRSGRIRTYNFPQGRVTDHRIGLTLYRLESILQGEIDEIIE